MKEDGGDFLVQILSQQTLSIRGSQRDVVYLGWPTDPSHMSPNAGGRGADCGVSPRVSSKWKKNIFGSNRNKPKQDLFRVCFGLFCETPKKNFSVCFAVSNLYRNNRNKQNCFETNRKNPEFYEKYQKNTTNLQRLSLRFMHSYFHHNLPFSF